MLRRHLLLCTLLVFCASLALLPGDEKSDRRLAKASRRQAVNGWIPVHLEGTPGEIGFQHGSLLAAEISEMKSIIEFELREDTKKDWTFFRNEGRTMMWPHVEQEYRDEMAGIAEGAASKGVKLDVWDIVAMNGFLEWGYYTKYWEKKNKAKKPAKTPVGEHCSAFVATGSYTKDGKVIIAHNNWTSYIDGARWTVAFDIVPSKGHRILMDGLPGMIASDDDFGMNSAGIMITETTISAFEGYDPNGIPEFVRARKAMQYSSSIDDFARIMKEGNNGGYANDWLIADRNTNEIASLELGLRNVTLERKKDGYFVGANFPINPKLIKEETTFDPGDASVSGNARRARWEQLMAENKGRIDVDLARKFLADHYDTFQKKTEPSERTLCGHVELSSRGYKGWQPPYGPCGAVQNKVADAAMAQRMSMTAVAGHACGIDFKAADHLKAHPEFSSKKKLLRDMPARPWTLLEAAR
jgi:hypothetical protein